MRVWRNQADAIDLKSIGEIHPGSSPGTRTKQ